MLSKNTNALISVFQQVRNKSPYISKDVSLLLKFDILYFTVNRTMRRFQIYTNSHGTSRV